MALDIFARSPGSSFFRRVDLRKSLKTVLSSPRSSSVRTPWPSDSFVRATSTFSRCSGLSGESGAVNLPRLATSSVAVLGRQFDRARRLQIEGAGHEKENDAGDEVEAKRMHIAGATPGVEVVRQLPRANQELVHRMEKFRVPVQEGIRGIQHDPKDRTAIVDRMLSALAAELARQAARRNSRNGSAVCRVQFRPAPEPKDSAPSRRLLGRGRSCISEDNLLGFVAHGMLPVILSRPKHDARHRDLPGPGEIRRRGRVLRRSAPESFWRCNPARW